MDFQIEFINACSNGDITVVNNYIYHELDIDYVENITGNSGLHFACKNNHVDIAKLLLSKKSSIDLFNNDRFSPLHYACQEGHLNIVELLIFNNGTINLLDSYNRTPFYIACKKGHLQIASLMLDNNAELDGVTSEGSTACKFLLIFVYYLLFN
jgi:ankyrin repeat protein